MPLWLENFNNLLKAPVAPPFGQSKKGEFFNVLSVTTPSTSAIDSLFENNDFLVKEEGALLLTQSVTIPADAENDAELLQEVTRNIRSPLSTTSYEFFTVQDLQDFSLASKEFGNLKLPEGFRSLEDYLLDGDYTKKALFEEIEEDNAFAREEENPFQNILPVEKVFIEVPTLDLAKTSDSGQNDTDNITNETMPEFTGTAQPGTTLEVFDGGISLGALIVPPDGIWSFTPGVGSAFSDGLHTLTVISSDAGGNSAISEGLDVTIKTTPPISILTLDENITADDIISASETGIDIPVTGTVTGEFNAGDPVTLTVNGNDYFGALDGSGNFSIDVPGSDLLNDPDKTIEATVTTSDIAGNTASFADTESYLIAPDGIFLSIDIVSENISPGKVVATLGANDPDSGGPFIYELTADADNKFEIVGNELRLRAGANLDNEAQDTHSIDIKVTDAEGASYTDTFDLNVRNDFEGEIREVIGVTDVIQTINFAEEFTDPVVFAFLTTNNDGSYAVARVTNVTSSSFDLNIQEPLDGTHGAEDVTYVVMEKGVHYMLDGTRFEVGTVDRDEIIYKSKSTLNNGGNTISFEGAFTNPNVLTEVQTNNHGLPFLSTRQNVNGGNIQVGLETYEDTTPIVGKITPETVAYFAIDDFSGNWGDTTFEADTTANAVRHSLFSITPGESYTNPILFLAKMATYDGADAGAVRGSGYDGGDNPQIFIDEDQVRDGETNHTTEAVSYLLFDGEDINLGESVTRNDTVKIYDAGALNDFGARIIEGLMEGDDLTLEGLIDENVDTHINLDDLKFLETAGEVSVTDDGTDVVIDFSVGATAGGTITLDGFGASTLDSINSIDELNSHLNLILIP